MNIVFRVDAGLHIGSGHVMRCLTLAHELTKQNHRITFICRSFEGNLCQLIESNGFDVVPLPITDIDLTKKSSQRLAHEHWLGVAWEVDANETDQVLILLDQKIDWLVVDHYAIDILWENRLRESVDKIMAIDDLADRHHSCDLLLDQNYGRNEDDYSGLISENGQLLVGPKYALLREEFAKWRNCSLDRRENNRFVQQILITMGGIDANNVTQKVLEALNQCNLDKEMTVVVVMGKYAPHLQKVQDAAKQMLFQTQVLVDVSNMAEVMANSDLAIGAAGSSSWERFCLGLPSIVTILAENQTVVAHLMEQQEYVLLLNPYESFSTQLADYIEKLSCKESLVKFSLRVKSLVDGNGCQRVVEKIGIESSEV